MSILDIFRRGDPDKRREPKIKWRVDPAEGIDFFVPPEETTAAFSDPNSYALYLYQLATLKQASELGTAISRSSMYSFKSDVVSTLENEFFELFEFPEPFSGALDISFHGATTNNLFEVLPALVLGDGQRVSSFSLHGPFLKLGESLYQNLSGAEFSALYAIQHHQSLSKGERTEYENLSLVAKLQECKKQGLKIELGQFRHLQVKNATEIGLAATATVDGGLLLSPTFGQGTDQQDVESRLGQLSISENASLRVKNTLILLTPETRTAAAEILANRKISSEQVEQFLRNPTSFIDATLIDLDTGFSLRVLGAELFEHKYFGELEQTSQDWFGLQGKEQPLVSIEDVVKFSLSRPMLEELVEHIEDTIKTGAKIFDHEGRRISIDNCDSPVDLCRARISQLEAKQFAPLNLRDFELEDVGFDSDDQAAVIGIESNDNELDYSGSFDSIALSSEQPFATSNLLRSPYEHQKTGIEWLLSHIETNNSTTAGGALLADDMGLGKTYMTLVAGGEWAERLQKQGEVQKPCLIVAPLSLLANWREEVIKTFKSSPFSEIVTLQSKEDLRAYKVTGAKRETIQSFDDSHSENQGIRYSLKIGNEYGIDRLDKPKRLILTTYQTLRDYQFSLSRVDWGLTIFDEAQNIKNPNAMQTRAAKAIKAEFKLLATGTPVENSLKDFWCLLDTCTPGLLGSWREFRESYIEPIVRSDGSPNVKAKIGASLRSKVGRFMLRRTKEECLESLPEKNIWVGTMPTAEQKSDSRLYLPMPEAQEQPYNEVLRFIRALDPDARAAEALSALHKLRVISLHPNLSEIAASRSLPNLAEISNSAKFLSTFEILDQIEGAGEKAIIFVISKAAQRLVATLVSLRFGIDVNIINGETQTHSRFNNEITRLGLIRQFESEPGFGIIVMSPIAAGVGLTVVEANHVIHLERHYNPAKEAQATDRVYRIGQTRPVHVYLPMAKHKEVPSFDERLHDLLVQKAELSSAVMVADPVSDKQLLDAMGLS
jgi:SNF2 family DNA or RNA helicase